MFEPKPSLQLPNPNGYWLQTIDIRVAPDYGLFTVNELQAFMMGLVKLDPTSKVDFRSRGEFLRIGQLHFDESIGTETVTGSRTIHITDPDVPLPDFFENGKTVFDASRTNDLTRRTSIWVYPDRDHAVRAMKGEDVYSTSSFPRIRGSYRRANIELGR